MNEYLQSSGIVDVRVDDRMVHGIVATMWIPENHCTRVMVVNEDASNNQVIRSTLKMSVPAGVSLSVLAPEKAAGNIKNGNYADQRVFIVGREIQDVYALYKAGVQFARVNLGNVTQNTGETLILDKTVRVNAEEKAMLREMRDAGIQITCQFRTDDPDKDLQGSSGLIVVIQSFNQVKLIKKGREKCLLQFKSFSFVCGCGDSPSSE